ncbi:MAG: tetratricopeptide repeat protein [Mucilaginibacter sp.]
MKKVVDTSKDDTTKAITLSKLGSFYVYFKPDSAMIVSQQAMLLSKKLKFEKGEAIALDLQGSVLQSMGNYPKSVVVLLAALKLNEKRNDPIEMIANLTSLGSSAAMSGDHQQSIVYTHKAKVLAIKNHYDLYIMVCNVNIGDSYEKLNILDSARFYTQQGYEQALKLKDTDFIAITNCNLGNIYLKMKNYGLALGYYHTAIPLFKLVNDDDTYCEAALGMAKVFKALGKKDSSLYYAHEAMRIGKNAGFVAKMLAASTFLTAYFKEQGDIDSAFYYQEASIVANDSLFSQEKTRELQTLAFEENQRQSDIEEQKILEGERNRRNLQLAGIAVFIPTFFLFILGLSRRRVKPRTIEFLGTLALLMVFEFIGLFTDPKVEELAHHSPAISLLILVAIAAALVPLHHKAEHWVKSKLSPAKHHDKGEAGGKANA